MKTLSLIAASALVAFSLGLPAMASGDEEVDAALKEKLTAQLVAEGYEVRKIQMEDGLIEAYAVKDGKTYELYFDASLKMVKRDGEDDES